MNDINLSDYRIRKYIYGDIIYHNIVGSSNNNNISYHGGTDYQGALNYTDTTSLYPYNYSK